jgi:ABC-2 type transport system ATP-binding protein
MVAIETEGLTKVFGSRRGTVVAVQDVTLRVAGGEVFGFLGPNGAGKTTTMRMLATLLAPTSGRAVVAGADLLREPARARERIGYVSQVGGAERSATARENLVLQGRLYGMARAQAQARAAELIRNLDLEAFADRLVRTYSGGQRRRLELAMGLMHRPALLFLDEPTAGLDPQSRARLWEEVRRLRGATSVFLTTHYLDEADALCDKVAIIDAGQIVGEDTPAALKRQIAGDVISLGLGTDEGVLARARALLAAQPVVREIHDSRDGLQLYVERGEEVLPVVLRLLDGASVPVRAVTLARPSLDDVFLRLTGHSLREADETP